MRSFAKESGKCCKLPLMLMSVISERFTRTDEQIRLSSSNLSSQSNSEYKLRYFWMNVSSENHFSVAALAANLKFLELDETRSIASQIPSTVGWQTTPHRSSSIRFATPIKFVKMTGRPQARLSMREFGTGLHFNMSVNGAIVT